MAAFSPLLDVLADVPDPRRRQGMKYKMPHVLLFAILAIGTGCNSCRGIAPFIDVHRHRLNRAFGLKWKRAPAHTAMRYILLGPDPTAVEVSFRRHAALLQAARATPGQGSIALDGKTLRGSFDNFHKRAAIQVLSAFATDTALVLAHIDIAETFNEIPAAQTLLAELGVPSSAIVRRRGQRRALIVQVKDNQPKPRRAPRRHRLDPANKLADIGWHPHVAAMIRVERDVFARNTRTRLLHHSTETAFYVSNRAITAGRAAEAIRAHWRMEPPHYSRDVTLGEDRSRIRTNPGVFARLRSFGFNILKANKTGALRQDRYRATLAGIGNLIKILAIS